MFIEILPIVNLKIGCVSVYVEQTEISHVLFISYLSLVIKR